MTIANKIQISADKTRFTLFKEGLFYKCYNEDAMVFVQNLKKYKVSVKFVKSVGESVFSIGFPGSVVNTESITFDAIAAAIDATSYYENATDVVFELKNKDLQNYASFKESVMASTNEPLSIINTTAPTTQTRAIALRIQEYDLANRTPMECMLFIQELKNTLNIK